jgi:hypothetical protein
VCKCGSRAEAEFLKPEIKQHQYYWQIKEQRNRTQIFNLAALLLGNFMQLRQVDLRVVVPLTQ